MAIETGTPPDTGVQGTGPQDSGEDDEQAREDAERVEGQRDAVRLASVAGESRTAVDIPVELQQSALEWFLSDEELPMEKTIDLNVGTPDSPVWIVWTIKSINGEQVKRARKMAEETNRAGRRAKQSGQPAEVDAQEANARIVVAGTLSPDLHEVARMKLERDGIRNNNPDADFAAVQVLKHKLRGKPGLIDQLAIDILGLSGYDDDDIREHAAGKA